MANTINQLGLENLLQLEKMGILKYIFKGKKQENLSKVKEQTEPKFTRRGLIKTGVRTAAVLGTAGAISQAENAMARMPGQRYWSKGMLGNSRTTMAGGDNSYYDEELPKYTQQDYDSLHPALHHIKKTEKNAWLAWKKDKSGGLALKFLKLDPSLKSESTTYYLLRAQLEQSFSDSEIDKIVLNKARAEFAKGSKKVYLNNSKDARIHLATGMFLSSTMDALGYRTMSNQGIKNLKITNNNFTDAQNLAKVFVNEPIENKLLVLELLNIDNREEFHWNQGLYIVSELQNLNTVKKLIKSNKYVTNKTKLGYSTASKALIYS